MLQNIGETTERDAISTKVFAAFVAVVLLVYIIPLGIRPLALPDEGRYAEIPREMIQSGDWILPRLDGLLYFEKPPMYYWSVGASMLLFGENCFAVRLPSALASIGTALVIGLFIGRRFGRRTGLVTAAIFLSSMLCFLVGTFAVIDPLFTFFITACLVSFFEAFESPCGQRKFALLIVSGVCSGLAFLTKGFLAGVVPALTITSFLLWQKQWKGIFRLPWLPMLAAVLVILPWGIAIHLRDGDFWRYFFWEEHIRRFTSSTADHARPWWYFIPTLLAGALPWTMFIPAAARQAKKRLSEPSLRYLLCWLVFPFIFFSAASGKIGTYILPLMPALAGLLAVGLAAAFRAETCRWTVVGKWCYLSLPALILIGFLVVQYFFPERQRPFSDAEIVKVILVTMGLAAWVGIGLWGICKKTKSPLFFALAPTIFMTFIPLAYPDKAASKHASERSLQCLAKRIDPKALVVSDRRLTHVVCWTLKRNDVYLIHESGEFRYGLSRAQGKCRLMQPADIAKRLAQFKHGESIVYITQEHYWKRYKKQLPEPSVIYTAGKLVAVEFRGPTVQQP